jgi:hypothetical protein
MMGCTESLAHGRNAARMALSCASAQPCPSESMVYWKPSDHRPVMMLKALPQFGLWHTCSRPFGLIGNAVWLELDDKEIVLPFDRTAQVTCKIM